MKDEPAVIRRRWLGAGLAVVIAFVVWAVVAWYGGAIEAAGWRSTLVDIGWTPWLLPASRLALDLSAIATVGFLLAASFLVPGRRDAGTLVLSPAGRTWVRAASWSAVVWAVAAAADLCFTMSDVLGVPVGQAVNMTGLVEVGIQVDGGRVLLAVIVLAAVVAVCARYTRTVTAAAATTLLAVLTVLPPAFAGHSAASGNHQLATSALVVHIAGAVIWTGGLFALLLGRRRPVGQLAVSVGRFSQLAIFCYVLVGTTGVVIALVRLWSLPGILTTFGLLVGLKVTALAALGGLGWWHRRRSIPALADGGRGVFARIAWFEVLIMAATFGLAVALSRTPAPDGNEITGYVDSPLSPVLNGAPEPIFFCLALAAGAAYLAGVRRYRDEGGVWPRGRTVAWITGWALVVFATDVQLAETTAFDLFDTVQHILIVTAVPVLLVVASPLTLARAALLPSPDPALRGPREWLDVLLAARTTRVLTRPVAAAVLAAAGQLGVYLSVVHRWSLTSHAAHLGVFGWALLAGSGYLWLALGGAVTGAAPVPGTTRRAMLITGGCAAAVTVAATVVPQQPPDVLVAVALAVPVLVVAAWTALHHEHPPVPGPDRLTASTRA